MPQAVGVYKLILLITKERGDTIFSDNKPTFTAKPRNHSRFYSSPFANPPFFPLQQPGLPASDRAWIGALAMPRAGHPSSCRRPFVLLSLGFFLLLLLFVTLLCLLQGRKSPWNNPAALELAPPPAHHLSVGLVLLRLDPSAPPPRPPTKRRLLPVLWSQVE